MTFWFSGRIEREIASQVPAGAQRCTFSPETASGDEFKATAWLDEQIISVVDRGTVMEPEPSLAVFNRDCRVLAAPPLPADTDITGIVLAPGATRMVRCDGDGTHVDGHFPL